MANHQKYKQTGIECFHGYKFILEKYLDALDKDVTWHPSTLQLLLILSCYLLNDWCHSLNFWSNISGRSKPNMIDFYQMLKLLIVSNKDLIDFVHKYLNLSLEISLFDFSSLSSSSETSLKTESIPFSLFSKEQLISSKSDTLNKIFGHPSSSYSLKNGKRILRERNHDVGFLDKKKNAHSTPSSTIPNSNLSILYDDQQMMAASNLFGENVPPFPSSHTYKQTPISLKRNINPGKIIMQTALEKLRLEKNLRNLMATSHSGPTYVSYDG